MFECPLGRYHAAVYILETLLGIPRVPPTRARERGGELLRAKSRPANWPPKVRDVHTCKRAFINFSENAQQYLAMYV